MKLDTQETAPSGKPVLKLRVGCAELAILRGLIYTALAHTPKTPETEKTLNHMRAMSRTLNSAEISAWIEKGDGA